MAVITQNYDIDLRATGEFPVVKMSQFDTGSRTIVFTVYDGHELAQIDGMVARVDGTRSDGVEFSSTCTVGTGSKVSFTISQEMTKTAGKHAAELVLFDASGNPIGTQNFIIDVEPATMLRDSAASADDRTLYDQYTQSLEEKFDAFKAGINDTIYRINELIGASSKPITVYDGAVTLTGTDDVENLVVTYDPITGLVHAWATGDVGIADQSDKTDFVLCEIQSKYCPDAAYFNGQDDYFVFVDNMREIMSGNSDNNYLAYYLSKKSDDAYNLCFRLAQPISQHEAVYQISLNATWYARGGKYMGVTPVPGERYSFGNGLKVNADGVVSVKAGRNLGFSSDGTLNAAGGGGDTSLTYAGSPTISGTVEYYSVK